MALQKVDTGMIANDAVTLAKMVAAARGGNYKNGRTSLDLSAATGTIVVTSMGFTPKHITIWGAKDGTEQYFFGHFGTQDNAMQSYEDDASGLMGLTGQDAGAQFRYDGSTRQNITLASLDADGFTLTNTKVGSPTGTGYFLWLALG